MSGYPRCASEAPSRKRTIAWTTEVGWTTTSIRSYGSPNRKCASISSSPLFASVAESTVIFGPMRHVGMRERVGAGHVSQLVARPAAERAARRREDDRVDRLRGRAPRGTGRPRSARCRPGASRPPPRSRAPSASSPAATRLSLFASASVTPRSSAQSVAGRPAKPTTAFRTTSGSARSSSAVRSPPTWACSHPALGGQRVELARAGRERAHLELGLRVDDLERLAPDRPRGAEDRNSLHDRKCRCLRAARRRRPRSTPRPRRRGARRSGRAPRRGPPSRRPESFTSTSRLSADSNRSPSGAATAIASAERERFRDREEVLLVERDERDGDRRHGAGDEPLPRLARRDRRRELVAAEEEPEEVGGRVSGPDREHDRVQREHAVLVDVPQQERVGEAEPDPPHSEHRHARPTTPPAAPLKTKASASVANTPRERPVRAAELGSEQGGDRAEIPGEDDRPQRPRHPVQLVQRDQRGDEGEPEQRPAAEVHQPEDERDPGGRDQDPRPERAHRPAEPPLPARVRGHRLPQLVLAEVGPERVTKKNSE